MQGQQWPTDEGVIGDGTLRVDAGRNGFLAWLARGRSSHHVGDRDVPELPAW